MDQSLEQLLEIVETLGHQFVVANSQFLFKLSLKVFVGNILVSIVYKFLSLKPILFEKTDILTSLVCHACYSEKLISFGVIMVQIFITTWYNSCNFHFLEVESLFVVELSLDNFVSLTLVFDILVFVLNVSHGSLLPTVEIVFVVLKQQSWVGLFEFIKVLFVDDNQNRSEYLGPVGVHE